MATVLNSVLNQSLEDIIQRVSQYTGIKFRETHKAGVLRYVEKRIEELGISLQEYVEILKNDSKEVLFLINASTVSETYFFREEIQFNLFKKLAAKKNFVNIWSAACANGEEIYSLKLICDSMHVQGNFFASDINTDVMEILKKGEYSKNQAVRNIDGVAFHGLLNPYLQKDRFILSEEIKKSVETARINLIDFESYESLNKKRFDFIFLRNVFIYFSLEQRYRILNYMAENYLLDDGYIFVSLSETAQLEEKCLCSDLEKICIDNVFVFHKKIQKAEVKYE